MVPFAIFITETPSSPKNFRYVPMSTPLFLWESGFSRGYSQTFLIQTRLAGQEQWTNQTSVEENDRQHIVSYGIYFTEVAELAPGTYYARLFALNRYGWSEEVRLNRTFVVTADSESADVSEGWCSIFKSKQYIIA